MSIIQFLILLFAVFAISRTVRQFRQGTLTIAWLIAWVFFWIVVGVVVIAPQTTDVVAQFVGVGRGADVVTYLSLISLFYLVFRLFIKIENLEGEITHLVRKLALEESQTDRKKDI